MLLGVRRELVWYGLVLLPYLLLPIIVPLRPETPYSDDFDYAETAWHLADTGRLVLSDWPTTTLAGHAAWGALFCRLGGNSYLMLRLSMFVLSAITAIALFRWCRRLGHAPAFSVLISTMWSLSPLTIDLEYTFLTDITGAALGALLVFFGRDINRRRAHWQAAYGTLGGVAFLSRQTAALACVMSVALSAWDFLRRRAPLSGAVARLLPFLVLVGVYRIWLSEFHGVPEHHRFQFLRIGTVSHHAERLLMVSLGLALHLAPVSAVIAGGSSWSACRRSMRVAAIVLACGSLLWFVSGRLPLPYNGEVFDLGLRAVEMPPSTVPSTLHGPRLTIGSRTVPAFAALACIVAAISAVILVVSWLAARRTTDRDKLSLAEWTLILNMGLLLVTWVFMDRYLLALLPLGLMIAAERIEPVATVRPFLAGIVATAMMAAFSVVGIQDGMRRSEVFWSVARQLHDLGVKPSDIDAGLAYGGVYRYSPTYRGPDHVGPYLESLPPADREVAVASFSPLTVIANRPVRLSFAEDAGYRVIRRQPFRSWLRRGDVLVQLRGDVPLDQFPPAFARWAR